MGISLSPTRPGDLPELFSLVFSPECACPLLPANGSVRPEEFELVPLGRIVAGGDLIPPLPLTAWHGNPTGRVGDPRG